MVVSTANPQVTRMIELNKAGFILNELYVHLHDFNLVHLLHEVADLVALFEAEGLWILHLKVEVVVTELLEVIAVLTLESSKQLLAMLLLFGIGTILFLAQFQNLLGETLLGLELLSLIKFTLIMRLLRLGRQHLVKLDRRERKLESFTEADTTLRVNLEAANGAPEGIAAANLVEVLPRVQHGCV